MPVTVTVYDPLAEKLQSEALQQQVSVEELAAVEPVGRTGYSCPSTLKATALGNL